MNRRIRSMALLATFALTLCGCPIPDIALGTWILTVDSNNVGIVLLDAGQTQEPIPLPAEADTVFNGTVTWEQNGRTIVFTQVTGAITAVYTGRLRASDEIVNGTWMQTAGGSASGIWGGTQL